MIRLKPFSVSANPGLSDLKQPPAPYKYLMSVPSQAAAVGYTTVTLGPRIVLGKSPDPITSYPQFANGANWVPYTFTGTSWTNIGVVQNADGSITMDGTGQTFGNGISTAAAGQYNTARDAFTGLAFGGGFYAEAVMKGTGPMSFWANDIETMNGVSVNAGPNPWPGQAAGFGDWMEVDIAEFDTTNSYGIAAHNWYGIVGSNVQTNTNFAKVSPPAVPTPTPTPRATELAQVASLLAQAQVLVDKLSGQTAMPLAAQAPAPDYTQYHKYGCLWVPATASSQGYIKYYFDDQEMAEITWNQYNPALPPAPIDNGTNSGAFPQTSGGNSAYSVLDTLHLALICGATSGDSVSFQSITVWQASGAQNLIGTGA